MTKRIIAFIPTDGYVKDRGYRVSLVVEGESGHYPTGSWPYDGRAGQQLPWFWGHDYAEAVKCAEAYNEMRGISKTDAVEILTSSIARTA